MFKMVEDIIKIRKAKSEDFKKIAEIFRKESAKRPYNEKWTNKTALQKIKEYPMMKYKLYIADKDNKVVGFVIIKESLESSGIRVFIEQMFVDLKFQGLGVGRELLNFVDDYCKKRKVKKIGLVSSNKSKAFKIYKKKGFKQMEKDFVYLEKKLKWM